jgi:hypothetical protein
MALGVIAMGIGTVVPALKADPAPEPANAESAPAARDAKPMAPSKVPS